MAPNESLKRGHLDSLVAKFRGTEEEAGPENTHPSSHRDSVEELDTNLCHLGQV